LSGLLAHESFGHLNEFDLVASGWSVLQGRLGERLADERMSIVDAPAPPDGGRLGVNVPIDDEGTRGGALRILDRGVLKANMHQRDSARAEGVAPTGNGRALDVRFPPIVRMRNTYIEPGDLTLDEALEALGDGLYLCGGRGGSPHSDGSFMFTSQHGYRVEGGRIVAPVKGPSIVGNILNFLPNVEGLTKDFGMFSNTFGGCGKWEQSFLHVGFGGPHILASDVLVGGHVASLGEGMA
jgi:TldD protein